MNPANRREVVDLLAVDAKGVDELLALPDPERGESDLVAVSHRFSWRLDVRGSAHSFERAPTGCGSRVACCVRSRGRSRSRCRVAMQSVQGQWRPRGGLECLFVGGEVGLLRSGRRFRRRQERQGMLGGTLRCRRYARRALRASRSARECFLLAHRAGENCSFEGGVAVDLRHTNRDVGVDRLCGSSSGRP